MQKLLLGNSLHLLNNSKISYMNLNMFINNNYHLEAESILVKHITNISTYCI